MNFETLKNEINRLYDTMHVTHIAYYHLWKDHIPLSWRWWVAFAIIVSSFLDMIGIAFDLWSCSTKVLPLMPSHILLDFLCPACCYDAVYPVLSACAARLQGVGLCGNRLDDIPALHGVPGSHKV